MDYLKKVQYGHQMSGRKSNVVRTFCLKDLVPAEEDLVNTVFLGFTRCGNFMVSNYQSRSAFINDKIGFWQFQPDEHLQLVQEWPVSSPTALSDCINIVFACQWPFSGDRLVSFCLESCFDEPDFLEVLEGTRPGWITICPVPRLQPCEECASDSDRVCTRHQVSLQRSFSIVEPYPSVDPRLTLNDPGRVFFNTGDSLRCLQVQFKGDVSGAAAIPSELPTAAVKLNGDYIHYDYWFSDGSIESDIEDLPYSDLELFDMKQRKVRLDECANVAAAKEAGWLVVIQSHIDMENLVMEMCSHVCETDGRLEFTAMDDFEFRICEVDPELKRLVVVGSVLLEGTNLFTETTSKSEPLSYGDFGFQLEWYYHIDTLVVTHLSSLTCHSYNSVKKPKGWNRHSDEKQLRSTSKRATLSCKTEWQTVRELAVLDPEESVTCLMDATKHISVGL